jgi:hypothetical protein
VRKDKLTRLKRATRAGREQKVLKEAFLNDMAQIKALVAGEEPPPHPRGAVHRIAGPGLDPESFSAGVPDLSEEGRPSPGLAPLPRAWHFPSATLGIAATTPRL